MHIEPKASSFKSRLNALIFAVTAFLPHVSRSEKPLRTLLSLPFLLLPFVEIAGFIVVGRAIGVLPTLGLIVLSAIVGLALMRHQGLGLMARIRSEMAAGRAPGRDLAHGVMILLAGLLLLIPGFVSDIAGLALFIPPVRDFVWSRIRSRVGVAAKFTDFSRRGAARPATIDLDQGDFSRDGNSDSPWRQGRED